MPLLPNSPDAKNTSLNTASPVIPDQEAMQEKANTQDAANYVESKVHLTESLIPPSNFVEENLNSFGKRIQKDSTIDVEFEDYFQQQKTLVAQEGQAKQAEESKTKFQAMMDRLTVDTIGVKEQASKAEKGVKTPVRVIPPIVNGMIDAVTEGRNAIRSLENVARRAFGVDELEKLQEINLPFEDSEDPGAKFIRSTAKLATEMIPISKGLKAATGITGVANSLATSGITGFIFDDRQTPGILTGFLKENTDIAPDILSYVNHEIGDNEFQTRVKNAANYVIDDAIFETAFYGIKAIRGIAKGKKSAYTILENGDVELTPTKKSESLLETVQKKPKMTTVGLTTEDRPGRTAADAIREEYQKTLKKLKDIEVERQAADPTRESMGHTKAIEEALKSPVDINDLLNRKFNEPVNNVVMVQADAAYKALNVYNQKNIIDKVLSGEMSDAEAYIRLSKTVPLALKLQEPRSTAGRALEATKLKVSLDTAMAEPDYTPAVYNAFQEEYGSSLKEVIELAALKDEGLTGISGIDLALKAMRKVNNPVDVAMAMQEMRINWMMSNPATFIGMNNISNAAMIPARVMETVMGAGISKGKSLVYGSSYMSRGVHINEAVAELKGLQQGLNNVISTVNRNIQTAIKEKTLVSENIKPLYPDNTYKFSTDKVNKKDAAEFARNWKNATPVAKAMMAMWEIAKGTPVSKTMRIGDSFAKAVNHSMELNRQYAMLENKALHNASMIKDPVKAADYLEKQMIRISNIKEQVKTSEDGVLPDADMSGVSKKITTAAKKSAAYNTFTDQLVGSDLHTSVFNTIKNTRANHPTLRILSPFFGFEASLSNKVLERTPVLGAIIKSKNYGKTTSQGLANLFSGGHEEDMFLAKQAMGFLVAGTTAMAIMNLEDTGDLEISTSGNSSQGIRINGVSIPADKSNPYFRMMTATKDFMDIVNLTDQEDAGEVMALSLASLMAELYSPKEMIEMMSSFSEAASGPEKDIPKKLINLFKNTALSYATPYSSAARFVNKERGATKPNIGQERGEDLIDEMMNKFKFIYLGNDAEVPKKYGIFGQEIPYKRTMGWEVGDTAHEMFAGNSVDDPTIKELMKLTREDVMLNPDNYNEFSLDNTTMLKMPPRKVHIAGEVIALSPSEYSKYVRYSAGEEIPGLENLKSKLDGFISSEKYSKLPVAQRIGEINHIVRLYRKIGKAKLLQTNTIIQEEAKKALRTLQEEYKNVKQ